MSKIDFTFCLIATVVTELERSTRFYCDGLGFEQLNTIPSGGVQMQKLLKTGTEPTMTARYLRKDGMILELVHFTMPVIPPATGFRPITQAGGPSHIAINVNDFEAALAQIRKHGGTVLDETRALFDTGNDTPIEMVLCLDPDGARIELLCMDETMRRQLVGIAT